MPVKSAVEKLRQEDSYIGSCKSAQDIVRKVGNKGGKERGSRRKRERKKNEVSVS